MPDESFREIQLSGKQLIALFMAAAVVLIGTFLSGVLVGRGVRSQLEPPIAADTAQAPGAAVDPTASTTAPKAPPQAEPQAQVVASSTPPPQTDETPAAVARGEATPAQTAVAAAAPAGAGAGAKPADAKPADAKPKEIPAAAAAPGGSETAGTGYYVKVVAYRTEAEADRMAARLSAKGYAAYVTPVTGKGASLYSVRVGKFTTRQDAEAAKRRLEQEEQLKPSIARQTP
jgi:cell division septation protein DedD